MRAIRNVRIQLVGVIAAAVVSTALPSTAASAAAAKPRPDRPWSGYAIRADGTAGGGWIGARKMGGKVVYRLDPSRSHKRAGYGPERKVRDLPGKRASRRDTVRAAYILSRYGTYRYAVQSAAVDVALDHLLVGGKFGLAGRKTAQRIRQTGQPEKVRAFAWSMLKESRAKAGAPRMQLKVTDAAVGGTVRATVRVRSADGRVLRDASVTVRYPGATTQSVRTDHAGTAVATFTANDAGRHAVVATVKRQPEWRLQVRFPKKPKASRLARAGAKAGKSVRRVAVISVRPTLRIAAPSQSMQTDPVPGRFTLSGGEPGSRRAAAVLFGPFSTAAATKCGTKKVATRELLVNGNGTYSMPDIRAPKAGFYTWAVGVEADDVNDAVSGCGGVVAVRVQPAVSVTRAEGTISAGGLLRSQVNVAKLPADLPYTAYATVRIYGPFADRSRVHCGDAKLLRRTTAKVDGNGKYWAAPVELNARGFYALVAVLPAGTFSKAARSTCGAANSMVVVQ